MKHNAPYQPMVVCLSMTAMIFCPHAVRAAVTLNANDTFTVVGFPTGDLTVTGDLSVVNGIDFGSTTTVPTTAAVQFNFFGGLENAVKFDLTNALGTFQWRDNLVGIARNKMALDSNNVLSLYRPDGTLGIQLNPTTARINLTGADGGIFAGDKPVFTMNAAGRVVFGNWPLSITNVTASVSSTTGALTVSGGIGTATDSYFNGVRVGRGGGNISSNTAMGVSALQSNISGFHNTANGYSALFGNTTGKFNTAVGGLSLIQNTVGNSNTSIGFNALSANTTGNTNVAIGSSAGLYQADGSNRLTDPDYSIYLGANSRGLSNSDQNSIVIGYGSVGEGANTTVIGNSNTIKTHLYGKVNASAFTINEVPVITRAFGANSVLSGNALLAIGNGTHAAQQDSIAIGVNAQALGVCSVALGNDAYCSATADSSVAMTYGHATKSYSLAASFGEANGNFSMAYGTGVADGDASIAIGGFDLQWGNWPGNHSGGENAVTLGGVGNQAFGFASFATGFWTRAPSAYSIAFGSLNRGDGSDATTWVETDPLFELGNGNAPRSWDEPSFTSRSNAITTLKNGQTTLTNRAWLANAGTPMADPDSLTDSGGEALVVDGHTRLRGKVIIEQAQGDISMGIYGP